MSETAVLSLGSGGLHLDPSERVLCAPDFECFVPGIPRPQGSKSLGRGGRGMRESSKYVAAWREAVRSAAHHAIGGMRNAGAYPLAGALVLGGELLFPRPGTIKSPGRHYARCTRCRGRQRRYESTVFTRRLVSCAHCEGIGLRLRPGAPVYVTSKPDVGKLLRAVEDSLTDAGVWGDDSQVVGYAGLPLTCKRYANPGEEPGARIRIWRV